MSISRTIILPVTVLAGFAAAQSASGALIAIRDFENFGLSAVDGNSSISRILAIGTGNGGLTTTVNSVFDQDSGRIFLRLMRVINGDGDSSVGGALGDILGGGPVDLGGSFESASVDDGKTHGLFDTLEVDGFEQYLSNIASGSSLGSAPAGSGQMIPFFFSTSNEAYLFSPIGGSGFAPSESSFSADEAGSVAQAIMSQGASAHPDQGSGSASFLGSPDVAGPVPDGAPAPAQDGAVAAVVSAGAASAQDVASTPESGDSGTIFATVVPEPSTAGMMICALGIFGLRRNRRSRA